MTYSKIKDLLDIKSHCAICGDFLVPYLKERSSWRQNFPIINSRLNDDSFVFRVKYTSPSLSIDKKCRIDINSNTFYIDGNHQDDDILGANIELIDILRVFTDAQVNVELHCCNAKCRSNYYITTTNLKLKVNDHFSASIDPIMIDWECYNFSHFWIQNDIIRSTTSIYFTNQSLKEFPYTKPIVVPLIEVIPETKDKVFNKIKTIVNFG